VDSYELDPSGIDPLLSIPESGPGYQTITLPTGHANVPANEYLVFNAELIIKFTDYVQFLTGNDPQNPPRAFNSYADFKANLVPAPIKIARLPSTPAIAVPPRPWPLSPTLVTKSVTSGPTIFWRLSSVNPDPRIRSGVLLPGSYLSSDDDVKLVNTGFGVVGRYALPSPFPASYLFECLPSAGETFFIGTTRPNFGQAGGGVEVFFQTIKTPIPGSFKKKLPDW
jgi:hypothetical protein